MGTCADFWLGVGSDARYLGSVGHDGYQWAADPGHRLMASKTADEFCCYVAEAIDLSGRGFLLWPWSWKNSRLTDFSYCFVGGQVRVYYFGERLLRITRWKPITRKTRRYWPIFRSDADG